VVAEVRNSLEWLPRGWILEIKTRLSGNSAGTKYKVLLVFYPLVLAY